MQTPEQAAMDLKRLAVNLKTAPPELRKQLLKELREAGKPTVHDIKAGILATFPNRGGLANRMAKTSLGVRNRLSGNPTVRLQGTSRQVRGLQQMDRAGTWRHPVFAWTLGRNSAGETVRTRVRNQTAFSKEERRSWTWVEQYDSGVKGWFTEPIENDLPRFRKAVTDAIEKTARDALKGVGN